MATPNLAAIHKGAGSPEVAGSVAEHQRTGRSRHLANDVRHLTDPTVRFAGIVVGIVNVAPVVILSVAQQPLSEAGLTGPVPRRCG